MGDARLDLAGLSTPRTPPRAPLASSPWELTERNAYSRTAIVEKRVCECVTAG